MKICFCKFCVRYKCGARENLLLSLAYFCVMMTMDQTLALSFDNDPYFFPAVSFLGYKCSYP